MHHAIQRILFDVEIGARERSEEIQNRISDHFRRRLEAVIEACLSEAAPPDAVLSLDRIELDLGPVSDERMESELEEKIRAALQKALSDTMGWPGPGVVQDDRAVSLDHNRLRLLETFLRHGFFPWSTGMQASEPDALLAALIETLPREIQHAIRTLGQQVRVRRRLAFQFAEPSIHRVIYLLEPSQADLIITYARDVQVVHEHKPIVPESARTFSRVRWELILTYLLVERGSHFNTRSFIKSFLRQMAQRYRVAYLDLLTGLIARVHILDLPFSTRYSLPALLLSLQVEEQTGLHPMADVPMASLVAEPYAARYTDLDVLAFFLLRGAAPAWGRPAGDVQIEALFQRLMAEAPEAVVTLVQTLGQRETVRKRLVRQFGEPTLRSLIQVLEPQEAPFILDYTDDLQAAHQKERVVQQDTEGFRQATWEFVLTYLLVERGSVFNTRMFVRSILRQIAARFNLAYEMVLAFVAVHVRDVPLSTTRFQRLVTIIERLQTEDEVVSEGGVTPEAVSARPPSQAEESTPMGEGDALEHFLRYGILPETLHPPTTRKLGRWLRSLPDATLRAVLRRVGPKQQALERLLTALPPTVFERLVRLLAPGEAVSILAYTASVRLARKRGGVIAEPAAAFRVQLRLYVLAYVLRARGAVSLVGLAEATLRAVAARYGVRYAQVLAAWGDKLVAPALLAVFRTVRKQEDTARGTASRAEHVIKPAYADTYTEADLVFYYLQQGAIPAWATVPARGVLRSLLLRLLAKQPDVLLPAWRPEMARNAAFRRRLLTLLPVSTRVRLLSALHPQFHVLASVIEELSDLHAQRPLVPRDRPAFQRASWDILIAFAATRRATRIDAATFLAYMLQELAARHGIRPPTLVRRFIQRVREKKASVLTEAVDVLEEGVVPAPAAPEPILTERALWEELTAPGRIDLLLYMLRYGAVPWWGRLLAQRPPEAWFIDLLHADQLLPALKQAAQGPQGVQRLMRLLPPTALSRLIAVLTPAYAGFVMTYLLAGERLEADEGLSQAARQAVRRVHWEVVLAWLLEPHAPAFRVAAFVAQVSRRIARQLGLSYDRYLEAMQATALARAPVELRYAPLAEVLSAERETLVAPLTEMSLLPPVAPPEEGQSAPAEAPAVAEALPVEPAVPEDVAETVALLRYFLQYGAFPAGGAVDSLAGLETRIRKAMRRRPEALRRLFLDVAGVDLERLRIVYQFAPDLVEDIVRLLIPEAAAGVLGLLEALLPVVGEALEEVDVAAWRGLSLEHLLRVVREQEGRAFDVFVFLRSLLVRLAQEAHRPYPRLPALLRARLPTGKRSATLRQLAALLGRLEQTAEAETPLPPAPAPAEPAPEAQPPRPPAPAPSEPASEAETPRRPLAPAPRPPALTSWPYPTEEDEDLPVGEPVYVSNAGLVLLWPYLSRFFDMLDMLEDRAFRDEETAYRAVYLLQYLAQGAAAAVPEYHLVLNKMLCGIETARPVMRDVVLTDEEKTLGDNLLYGVTQNWTKLKNTSIDGLRETFLMRQGRLLNRDDAWSLTVATKSYDVLLDFLPWSLSTIRLPWMKKVLFVEWR